MDPARACLKKKRCSREDPCTNDGGQDKTHKILKSLMHCIIVLKTTDHQFVYTVYETSSLGWTVDGIKEDQSGTTLSLICQKMVS